MNSGPTTGVEMVDATADRAVRQNHRSGLVIIITMVGMMIGTGTTMAMTVAAGMSITDPSDGAGASSQ